MRTAGWTIRRGLHIIWIVCVCVRPAAAQRDSGELRIEAHDPQGAVLVAAGELVSEGNQFRLDFQTGEDGRYIVQNLAFGVYRVRLTHTGFAPYTHVVEIHSTVPQRLSATLGLSPVETQVEVTSERTLVDPSQTGAVYTVGSQTLTEELPSQPGRGVLNAIDAQPGWVYEANGVLHPRGSEYDVQFVVDGLPLTENRSPTSAPPFDSNDVESMRVMTANFPAEYGRKLGGVVEISPPKNTPMGWHGELEAEGGSFAAASGHAALFFANAQNRFAMSGDGFHTDRYLDPPVLANYANRGNAGGFSASYERDFSGSDRLLLNVTQHAVRYLVPNELVQQQAGQRQDLTQQETSGQAHYTHTFSPELVMSLAGSIRDAAALLSSNPESTPVLVSQDRGYREGYVRADLAGEHGRHDWKIGADGIFNPVHEALRYQIMDPTQFDPGTQLQFQFSGRKWDIEPSAFVQDQIRVGNWNVNAGLRFDHYGFVVNESAWSPRVGVSRYLPSLNLLVHASYDRVFQTPAMENLLLASSPALDSVSALVLRLPIRPGRANYYEMGVTESILGKLRIDANVFRRSFHNFSDDDTLLDTSVSFPIAFASARISGEEIQLAVPHWGRFSGFVSYSNQAGIGQGPITGGLFLGDKAANTPDTSRFAISQDQRNTARARVRMQAMPRLWVASSAEYGSGLPVHLDSPIDINAALGEFGPGILSRVNLATGRVRPNFSLDAAAGAVLYHKEGRDLSFQIEGGNLTNRVNVLNFASLFSGTAVAISRSVTARMKVAF